MDHIAGILLGFSREDAPETNEAYDKAAKSHVSKVTKLLREQAAVVAATAKQLFECIHPYGNTMSYSLLLEFLSDHIGPSFPQNAFQEEVMMLIMSFDARQVRFVGTSFANLMMLVGDGQLLPPAVAVDILAYALRRIDGTGSMMTAMHYLLAKLAYTTDNIELALSVLNKEILYYPGMTNQPPPFGTTTGAQGTPATSPATGGAEDGATAWLSDMSLPPQCYISHVSGLSGGVGLLRPATVMEYDLVRAMCYISRRDWAAAHAALERVVTYPSRDGGVSRLQLDAYKKWVLVSLVRFGGVPSGASASDVAAAAAKLSGQGLAGLGAALGRPAGGGGGGGAGGAGLQGTAHPQPPVGPPGSPNVAVPLRTGPSAARAFAGPLCKPYLALARVFEAGWGGVVEGQDVSDDAEERAIAAIEQHEMAAALLAAQQQQQEASEDEGVGGGGNDAATAVGGGDVSMTAAEAPAAAAAQQQQTATTQQQQQQLQPLSNLPPALQLRADATSQAALWRDDGNSGLVAEVQKYYQRWQVASLRAVYSKVSFAQIRNLTRSGETGLALASDDEVGHMVRGMLDEGMLVGEIVGWPAAAAAGKRSRTTTATAATTDPAQPPAHLVFLPPSSVDDDVWPSPSGSSEESVARQLVQAAAAVRATEVHVRATRERLSTHREYLRYVIASGLSAQGQDAGGDNVAAAAAAGVGAPGGAAAGLLGGAGRKRSAAANVGGGGAASSSSYPNYATMSVYGGGHSQLGYNNAWPVGTGYGSGGSSALSALGLLGDDFDDQVDDEDLMSEPQWGQY